MNWINVEDELPKEEGPCLCYDNHHKQIRVLVFNDFHDCWDQEDGDDYYTDSVGGKVTHWMKLPELPNNIILNFI